MKRLVLLFFVIISLVGCSNNRRELFRATDKFVSSLDTTYESYGILGGSNHAITASDGLYRIMPLGRLINVKIMEVVEDEAYERLRKSIARHYEGDLRVHDVYINQVGTIMIDCRN